MSGQGRRSSDGADGSQGAPGAAAFDSFVAEAKALTAAVAALVGRDQDATVVPSTLETLEKYQEQPQLLDPHLSALLTPLLQFLRVQVLHRPRDQPTTLSLAEVGAFRIVYTLCKVRGYKTAVRFFPHAVADLEPAFACLLAQDRTLTAHWFVRYVLLLWLSMLALVPFDLSTIDSNDAASGRTLVASMVALGQSYLGDSAKTRDGAAIMLARLLTRPDMQVQQLGAFVDWSVAQLRTRAPPCSTFLATGILTALAAIFKHGQSASLVRVIPSLMPVAVTDDVAGLANALHRKLCTKLAQRIALAFLAPRVAPWRYQRGSRSLLANVQQTTTGGGGGITAAALQDKAGTDSKVGGDGDGDGDGDGYHVVEEIEDVVDVLLQSLCDSDTVVRWSAAKGIGRITMRLPADLADEVVAAVLDLLRDGESDAAWHGACLAIAELARRGLLLPARLPIVVPLALKALQYDEFRGAHSVGAHVRDAACYVMWAFARAYSKTVMAPWVDMMAGGLLITAVFDREVNCRRAAAAAFQENVGRQGNFPHGIDIVTTADYFAVGNRINAYCDIAVYIAGFPEYRRALIDHLAGVKISHWDPEVRLLACRALACHVPCDVRYAVHKVLPQLVPATLSQELALRHGATVAIADVLLALSALPAAELDADCAAGTAVDALPSALQRDILAVVPDIERARLYRGRGGEVMRGATAKLIECMARARLAIASAEAVAALQATIDEHLKHPKESISQAAVAAMQAFSRQYYVAADGSGIQRTDLVLKYSKIAVRDANPAARRGFTSALGKLPAPMLLPSLPDVVLSLHQATRLCADPDERDAETRRNAVTAMADVVETVGIASLSAQLVHAVWITLLHAAQDYAVDNRGDVGSWVREAAIMALVRLSKLAIRSAVLTPDVAAAVFGTLAQQSVERIDRMRSVAGKLFLDLLFHPDLPHDVPHRDAMRQQWASQHQAGVNMAVVADVVPIWVQMLALPSMPRYLVRGLVASMRHATDSLAVHTSRALSGFLLSCPPTSSVPPAVIRDILSLLTQPRVPVSVPASLEPLHAVALADAVDTAPSTSHRLCISALRCIAILSAAGVFDCVSIDLATDVYMAARAAIKGCGDASRVSAAAAVFAGFLSYPDPLRKRLLSSLLLLMGHQFPKVRLDAARQMQEQLMVLQGQWQVSSEVGDVLRNTHWMGPLPAVRQQRAKLYAALDIPPPVKLAPRRPPGAGSGKAAQGATYADLVNEAGY